jgi:16S rRNA (cytosine967-C5)-methyltransferase
VTAREVALEVLRRVRDDRTFASESLDDWTELSPPDRRLAMTLAYGVIRRRATLDALIAPFLSRPLSAIDLPILDILHLGAFQIVLLDAIPPHAAVHETVELTRFANVPQASGLVNGVLRRVSEVTQDEFTDHPAATTVPFDLDDQFRPRYRRLLKPLFDFPRDVDYLSAGFSWPMWLADRWIQRFGFQECCRLGFWFNAPPPLWIRVNERFTSRNQLASFLPNAVPGFARESLILTGAGPITQLPGFAEGHFAVQDHASQLVVDALDPRPGWTVLDLCAAPGGKTTHLAERMNNQGRIVACDSDGDRLSTVRTLCDRMHVSIVETLTLSDDQPPPEGPFDAAIVDAPCSNTGVMGRRPEVRWRIKPHEFQYLIQLQTRLLRQACERVRPSGVIVYSTCSIEPDENRGVVDRVIEFNRNLWLEADAIAIPGQPSDGGYWARLRVRE